LLSKRVVCHEKALGDLYAKHLWLDKIGLWPEALGMSTKTMDLAMPWHLALEAAGKQNASPTLPVEGILLTLRLNPDPDIQSRAVLNLLDKLEEDALCNHLVVLALDRDDAETQAAEDLKAMLSDRCSAHFITNPVQHPSSPFPICEVWNNMGSVAFENGADWVVLLGDDVDVRCPFHYRAFYRSFLDISARVGVPFGFGCPWWNDETFPGFPTFPVVGKTHYKIFGSLIPPYRDGLFVNQDLDPYLFRLYLKAGAAPLIEQVKLRNKTGGNFVNPTRYERIHAEGWQDFVLEDVKPIMKYLKINSACMPQAYECLLVDIVSPTARLDIDYLTRICSLRVPERMRTTFIIVVDSPDTLNERMGTHDIDQGASRLESILVNASAQGRTDYYRNNIRVRCNRTNMGASAARNRGIDESSAEFILFLDDDVLPEPDLLTKYEAALLDMDESTVGLVGLVQFPRTPNLPIVHAAVLMSYLTFVFEIASNPMYQSPAWGVTANILVKRLPGLRFDTSYAKTGGGEDVDFCLRILETSGGRLMAAPAAMVTHEFWPGSLQRVLLPHFFRWSVGDGALFLHHRKYRYLSWPNLVEFLVLYLGCRTPLLLWSCKSESVLWLVLEAMLVFPALLLVDIVVDMSNKSEFTNRCRLLGPYVFKYTYYIRAHMLANIYVAVLEAGRLFGHWRRGELQNICHRFDWHCGRLPHARGNFVRRELVKFLLFLATVLTAGSVLANIQLWNQVVPTLESVQEFCVSDQL
jgi:glycosyltransferase involved in cell wall biosynthesis